MGGLQGSGVDAVWCHAWPGVTVGEWQAHSWAPRAGAGGSALSRRVTAWRVWVDVYRGMAGAGREKHKISTKEVPPWNGRWGALLGGLSGFGGELASPLVWMWINLVLGSISLHVTSSLHAEYF